MGCVSSKPNMIPYATGDEKDYFDRFLEDKKLGEGEFGIVKMVIDLKSGKENGEPCASKALRKGITFKDNTLYTPLKPEILKGECDMLRTLNGEHHIMKLIGVYESSSLLYIVTEFCAGGEMMEYVSKAFQNDNTNDDGNDGSGGGLRSEDVSRISYELLDAVNHCARHGVLHRDIKPENVMFKSYDRNASLRLIDFGSGTMDTTATAATAGEQGQSSTLTSSDLITHTTFAGSAFYISPEMFQHTYTYITDVWSAGVTLYVLVAGYPADELQKAFNMLQKSKRDLRSLPNMPDNMPDSFFDMLSDLLVYKHKQRKTAGDIMEASEFVQFHKTLLTKTTTQQQDDDEEEEDEKADAGPSSLEAVTAASSRRTRSVLLKGSSIRHTAYLEYEKFERSVTTLLATVLSKNEFADFIIALNDRMTEKKEQPIVNSVVGRGGLGGLGASDEAANEKELQVIKCRDLNALLKEKGFDEAASIMDGLPNASMYDNFAYRVALLRPFSKDIPMESTKMPNGSNRSNRSDSGSRRGNFGNISSRSFRSPSSGLKKAQSVFLGSGSGAGSPLSSGGSGDKKARPSSPMMRSMTSRFQKRDTLNSSSHM